MSEGNLRGDTESQRSEAADASSETESESTGVLVENLGQKGMALAMDTDARNPNPPELDIHERYKKSDEIPFGD